MRYFLTLLLIVFLPACATQPDLPEYELVAGELQARSLLGDTLRADPLGDIDKLSADLDAALAQFEANPSADNLIWVGRRLGYLWQYDDAIAVFTRGIEAYPDDARIYRHRGHRYISVREFEKAVEDFERAAALVEGTEDQIEPDGAPNAAGIPVSTLQFNIWYHLGLAHYLLGDYEAALDAYRACMVVSKNNDSRVATADWMYMTLRKLGRDEAAQEVLPPFSAETELIENQTYLRRMLMYKGELSADSLLSPSGATELDFVTQGYGVANWRLAEGDTAAAKAILEKVVESDYWPAFGFIAAEAELDRLIH